MSKMQGAEHNKKGRGLEYLYLNVQDEDIDGRCKVMSMVKRTQRVIQETSF